MCACAVKSLWISDLYLYSALSLGYHCLTWLERVLSCKKPCFWLRFCSRASNPPNFNRIAFWCLIHPYRTVRGLLLNQLFVLHLANVIYLFIYLLGGGGVQFLHPIFSLLFSHSLCSPALNNSCVDGCGSLHRMLEGFLAW